MKSWIKIEFDEGGAFLNFQPSDMPTWVIVDVLFGALENMKRKFDESPGLNPADVKAWQMLGRLG